MNKAALECLIIAVSYTEEPAHIDKVLICETDAVEISNSGVVLREEVVRLIRAGKIVHTATPDDNGGWTRRAKVELFETANGTFIRTVGNDTTCDNLGELPEFITN